MTSGTDSALSEQSLDGEGACDVWIRYEALGQRILMEARP